MVNEIPVEDNNPQTVALNPKGGALSRLRQSLKRTQEDFGERHIQVAKEDEDGRFPDIFIYINFYSIMLFLILVALAWSFSTLAGWFGGAASATAQTEAWMAVGFGAGYMVLNCIKMEGRKDLERLRKILAIALLALALVLLGDAIWRIFGGGFGGDWGENEVVKGLLIIGSILSGVVTAVVAIGNFAASVTEDVVNLITGDEDGDGLLNIVDPDYWATHLYNENPENLDIIRTGFHSHIQIGDGYLTLTPFGGFGFVGGSLLSLRAIYKSSVIATVRKSLGVDSPILGMVAKKQAKFQDLMRRAGIAEGSTEWNRLMNNFDRDMTKAVDNDLYSFRRTILAKADDFGLNVPLKSKAIGRRSHRFVNIMAQNETIVKDLNNISKSEIGGLQTKLQRSMNKVSDSWDKKVSNYAIALGRQIKRGLPRTQAVAGIITGITATTLKVNSLDDIVVVKNARGGQRIGVMTADGVEIIESKALQRVEDMSGAVLDVGKGNVLKVPAKIKRVSLTSDARSLVRTTDLAQSTELNKAFKSTDLGSIKKINRAAYGNTLDMVDTSYSRSMGKALDLGEFTDARSLEQLRQLQRAQDAGHIADLSKFKSISRVTDLGALSSASKWGRLGRIFGRL